jgi:hypothetical protein
MSNKKELNEREKILEEKKKGELKEDFSKAVDSYTSIYRILGEIKEEEGKGDNLLFRFGDYVVNELRGEEGELAEIDKRENELDARLEELEVSIKDLKASISRLKNNGKIFSVYKRFEKELDKRN